MRAELCGVCRRVCPLVGTIYVGGFDDDQSEMPLCPACASLVFPGMREAMAASCPICNGSHV